MTDRADAPPSRARVAVLRQGADVPSLFLAKLEREVLSACVVDTEGVLPRDLDVLVVWLRPACNRAQLRAIVDRAQLAVPGLGTIACAPNGDSDDAVLALEAGVDDAVAGRCTARELACRIHALHRRLRRQHAPKPRGPLCLDAPAHQVRCGDRTIRLSATETSVLRALVHADGRPLSRSLILDSAWGAGEFDVGERAVDNVILRLRRKLGDGRIETVRGVGFRLAMGS